MLGDYEPPLASDVRGSVHYFLAPNFAGSVVCEDCAAGSYNSDPGQVSCTTCEAGTISTEAGQTSCIVSIFRYGQIFNVVRVKDTGSPSHYMFYIPHYLFYISRFIFSLSEFQPCDFVPCYVINISVFRIAVLAPILRLARSVSNAAQASSLL